MTQQEVNALALETKRRLARIERITRLEPIPDRDRIELAWIGGWSVIVPKGMFKEGDRCVYFEPDAFLPAYDLRFSEAVAKYSPLRKHPITEQEGYKLGVAKIAGVASYGLALPLSQFPEYRDFPEGADLSDYLHIRLWETIPDAKLVGMARGKLPVWIQRTDEERIQNLPLWFFQAMYRYPDWYVTEKIDGASITIYVDGDYEGVASRNIDLKPESEDTYWATARKYEFHRLIRACYPKHERVAIQGELFGPGIQKNPLRMKEHQIRLFNLQIGEERIPLSEWHPALLAFAVPIIELPISDFRSMSILAAVAGKKSTINPEALMEGVVVRRREGLYVENPETQERLPASFKVINLEYLVRCG